MDLAPILIFCYSRKNHLEHVINSLMLNPEYKDSVLYIYSDASRNDIDKLQVDQVRSYIRSIFGCKEIYIIEREKNYGLAENIISGVTEIVNKYGKVIILEDDLVVSEYFLKYMNRALDFYQFNNQIISIHGYVYPIENLPDYFFLRGADCWGWATWKRGWDLFEKDGLKLLNELKHQNIDREFDYNYSQPFKKMLEDQIVGKNNSWAIRWYTTAYLHNMLTLYPGKSLVQNIGHDGSGTHCGDDVSLFNCELADFVDLNALQSLEIKENKRVKSLFESFHLKIGGFRLRLKFYAKKFLYWRRM